MRGRPRRYCTGVGSKRHRPNDCSERKQGNSEDKGGKDWRKERERERDRAWGACVIDRTAAAAASSVQSRGSLRGLGARRRGWPASASAAAGGVVSGLLHAKPAAWYIVRRSTTNPRPFLAAAAEEQAQQQPRRAQGRVAGRQSRAGGSLSGRQQWRTQYRVDPLAPESRPLPPPLFLDPCLYVTVLSIEPSPAA